MLSRNFPAMPEVFAVLVGFAVAVFIFVMMWIQSRDPALYKPTEELPRMQHQIVWIDDRIAMASREKWEAGLQGNLKTQREEIALEILKVQAVLAKSTSVPALEVARRTSSLPENQRAVDRRACARP